MPCQGEFAICPTGNFTIVQMDDSAVAYQSSRVLSSSSPTVSPSPCASILREAPTDMSAVIGVRTFIFPETIPDIFRHFPVSANSAVCGQLYLQKRALRVIACRLDSFPCYILLIFCICEGTGFSLPLLSVSDFPSLTLYYATWYNFRFYYKIVFSCMIFFLII